MISLIVPTLNEERVLPAFLADLANLRGFYEVIFADGGSRDGTLSLLKGHRVMHCVPGRGSQMNAAARLAQGDRLWFVHADSRLHPQSLSAIERCGALWGCFRLVFDRPSFGLALIARASNMRVRWRHVVFGDQGPFMTRAFFDALGGWPELPLMEDYHFSLQCKVLNCPPVQLALPIVTSSRRFDRGGLWRTLVLMQRLQRAYRQGGKADELCELYRREKETPLDGGAV